MERGEAAIAIYGAQSSVLFENPAIENNKGYNGDALPDEDGTFLGNFENDGGNAYEYQPVASALLDEAFADLDFDVNL